MAQENVVLEARAELKLVKELLENSVTQLSKLIRLISATFFDHSRMRMHDLICLIESHALSIL